MTTSMGPPPTTSIATATTTSIATATTTSAVESPSCPTSSALELETPATSNPSMGPPPPQIPSNPNTQLPESSPTQQSEPESAGKSEPDDSAKKSEPESIKERRVSPPPPPPSSGSGHSKERQSQNAAVPYSIPRWSEAPSYPFHLEVLKDGSIIDQLDVTKKGAYMFGRIDLCDFVLEHPTISRFHAVLQFKGNGHAYLYDLGSTHGTFINKNQVKEKVYVELHVGDVIRFGLSSRLYIFQGPTELMPQEADLTNITYAKDREASLRRARETAALADGISWGMGEDAVEEAEDDQDEITWQNYRGELTERQQKTREKILKRMEKIAHMKKEISAIRAKDISQGGLTQGQQTQIARNEMRIAQIFEELESLEETLNDSIRESIGARAGKSSRGRQKGAAEDEDELLSDDDEFYDRTKKKSGHKSVDKQAIETADSLLDKKEALMKEMEEKRKLILEEKNKMPEPVVEQEAGDALDAFMTGLSSQLVVDKTVQLEKDVSSLQTELDRIVYLLKIADPMGEAVKKREKIAQEHKSSNESASSKSAIKKPEKSQIEQKKSSQTEKPVKNSVTKQAVPDLTEEEANDVPKPSAHVTDSTESKPAYQPVKPQWLGAVADRERKEILQEKQLDTDDGGDEFVDYKDRKKILDPNESQPGALDSDLENAAPGLILRKKKQVEKSEDNVSKPSKSGPAGADTMAENAVALLLKHKRGLYGADEESILESHDRGDQKQSGQDNKRPKRVLGPEKPAFLEKTSSDYETWVPPEGQSGDGRTSLNDRLGY